MLLLSKVKTSPKLIQEGKLSYEWAKSHMQILDNTINRYKKLKPLKGITLGFCLHITKETSVLLMGAKELGATVACCGGNPLTTQDNIAAFLASQGINVYSWHGQSVKEYDWCIDQVLKHKPTILTDDGADMNIKAHFDKRFMDMKILGATEETTAGVTRIRAVENQGKLRYPVILVNEAYTKHMFDNRYGTGQSTIDGFLRAMNLLMASKRVVVVGYGWVGRGVASRFNGMGSKVIVTEVDPVKALEAHMDGFEVMPMNAAAKIGDMFVTCTGMTSVIRKEHILQMKNGAIMGNVGHFDVEIDAKFLLKSSKSVREVRPNLDECTLKNGKIVYLIGQGRLANLVAAEGHPPEVMAQSFSNQILSVLYILKNHKNMENKIINVPEEIDKQIAVDALDAMDVKIDKLTPEQVKYANNW
ncbi:MAG: adenosylhomocysteinase [Nitrosopumilus sp.]|nr:adenosylhomocysteinase [Nitrosopumilus sp.]MDF2423527.1 adenosylhomocysteinase [Nitrosopumilus sp.]MDF2424614.1 adenosylhomocysteinase [Nitrosopumilus sp.]MDF2425022.1 adenosylhomocysteinase [Nitrosopumilus sp.]MDF2427464.1 adenosylhomocysteinase [Nitrosopumilus sp.]